MASESSRSGVGRVIDSRYRLVTRLGTSGVSQVWLARDQLLRNTEVVLKRIAFRNAGGAEQDRIARVRAEARRMAGLRGHPNVVTVYDILEHEGTQWIVMEYVPGALDLKALVTQRGALPPAECARIGLAALDALTAGHDRGIMHRDVKPSNILLVPDRAGRPYARILLANYGLSGQPETLRPWYTYTHVPESTAGYLAPERAEGGPPTAAADLFSLGCTLYYAVEGRGPFERDSTLAALTAVVMEEPHPLLRAGPLKPLLAAMLAKDPERRTTPAEAEAALSALLTPEPRWHALTPGPPGTGRNQQSAVDPLEPHRMTAELAEQAPSGREVPLHVQIIQNGSSAGVRLRSFPVPAAGARVMVTVHAPGLQSLGDLQQEVSVIPERDSDVMRFGLRTAELGLHTVTVRAFHGGTFLGELRAQISVQADVPMRDGLRHSAPLVTLAVTPGEATLQVLKDKDGSYSFQLLSETANAPETQVLAGDPRGVTERIYGELRRTAAASGIAGKFDRLRAKRRLRNLGVQLWATAVPDAVRRQFWNEAGRITSLTVLGEHDVVPWELLYPLDGRQEGDGFLAEWMPVVRRTFGQDRVRELSLSQVSFVVPPGSPPEAEREVAALRTTLGHLTNQGGPLTHGAAVSDLIDRGLVGLLHFACHNAFTSAGSHVSMADGPFEPLDLAYTAQSGSLRAAHPLVFFNACRSAGQIDWFSTSLGWATQFLRSGAGAFVGTLWPVRSDSALAFADTFYRQLITHGQSLGHASLNARRAIRDQNGDPTWLAYAVYGSPDARVRAG